MELSLEKMEWIWFKGNQVPAQILQTVCEFRSRVLFDSGFRQNFARFGGSFGDIQYSDFESLHIIAHQNSELLGTVRITLPRQEIVALSVLGIEKYFELLTHIKTDFNHCIEINRLMIDERCRKLALGRTLMYAAIALVENYFQRDQITIIGSAGNCTKQKDFFLKYTDYELIDGVSNYFAKAFNDEVSLLKYKNPPYSNGVEWIHFFDHEFKNLKSIPENLYFHRREEYTHPQINNLT